MTGWLCHIFSVVFAYASFMASVSGVATATWLRFFFPLCGCYRQVDVSLARRSQTWCCHGGCAMSHVVSVFASFTVSVS